MIALVDLGNRLYEDEVFRLIEQGTGSASAAQAAIERYRLRDWTLLGREEAGHVVGCLGVELTASRTENASSASEIVLHSLAVAPSQRGRGIGRALIRGVVERLPDAVLMAETDADAVGFYLRCGFRAESLGEKYPGIERFRCVLAAASDTGGGRS